MANTMVFEEIAPAVVKKLITGKGNATKDEAARALLLHVVSYPYVCDDESDAVAVGVAWLVVHKIIKLEVLDGYQKR